MFENAEIGIDALPSVDAVEWQDMDPAYVTRLLAGAAIALLLVLAGIGALHVIFSIAFADENVDIRFGWLWAIPFLVAIPLIAWPLISVPKKGYAVRERDILYRSGVAWQTVTAIPFNRIQHVEKSSTPLDRRFKVATLQLFTAGGSGGDLRIHGLPARVAEKLRFFILEKIGSSVESG